MKGKSRERPSLATLRSRTAALERGGDWEAAADGHEDLWRRGTEDRDLPSMLRALRSRALIRNHQGRRVEAAELAELSLAIAEVHGLTPAIANAMNIMGVVRHTDLDLEGALPLYESALERAREARDDPLVGAVCRNLGVIANMRGDLHAARSWYLESVGSAVRSGDLAATVMAYNNLGMVCADLHEWMEAEIHFSRGIEIAEELGDAALLALLYLNRAEPLIYVGELDRADETLTRAEKIGERIGRAGVLADAARFRAMMARRTGDLTTANRHLSRSLLIAAKSHLTLGRAEGLEELARLRWAEGNAGEAIESARQALHAFESLGARGDAGRLQHLLEEWETAGLLATWSVE